MERIKRIIEKKLDDNPDVRVVTVNVFGVVLVPRVGDLSSALFRLGLQLQAQGLLDDDVSWFVRARIRAEDRARQNFAGMPVSLVEIYRELWDEHHDWDVAPETLEKAELDVQRELIVPVPGIDEMLSLVRRKGRKLVFVSDTHLPEAFLRERLADFGLLVGEDGFYSCPPRGQQRHVSAACFSEIASQHGITLESMLHVGSHPVADDHTPRRLGMHALHFTEAWLNRYERELEAGRWASNGVSSYLAGAARLSRLHHSNGGLPNAYLQVLTGVAAPLLVSFVAWTLRMAQQNGLERLYFLSREGEVLFELARILARRMNLDVQLHYLYVSRPAVNKVLLKDPTPENLAWALTHTGSLSLRSILNRVDLDPEDLADKLVRAGFDQSQWDERLNDQEWFALLDILAQPDVSGLLSRKAQSSRGAAMGYLEAAGIFDDVAIGFVDTAGTGSQMRALHMLRRRRTDRDCVGFQVRRMWRDHLEDSDFPTMHAYLSDHMNGIGIRDMNGLNHMLEVFTVADYGTVIGYEERPEGVVPVFEDRPLPEHALWRSQSMREPMFTYAENMVVDECSPGKWKALREPVMRGFWQFWYRPTLKEADIWGRFPVEVGFGDDFRFQSLAPRLSLPKFMKLRSGDRVPGVLVNPWYAGLEKRARWPVPLMAAAYRWGREFFGKAFSVVK